MITRYNYEEFFLLYVDNELSAAERKTVEEFVHRNPDLEEELTMLRQSVIKPEGNIIFENKDSLLQRAESNSFINHNNYEEYFCLYIDNELDATTKKEVEKFASQHPALQTEFSLLQETRLEPEAAIVFEGKEILYRKEESKKPIPLFVWITSIAAVAILLVTGFLFFNNRPENADKPVASVDQNNPIKKSSTEKNNALTVTPAKVDSFNKEQKQNVAIKETKPEKQQQNSVAKLKKTVNKENKNEPGNLINDNLTEDNEKANTVAIANVVKPIEEDKIQSTATSNIDVAPNKLIVVVDKPDEIEKETKSSYAKLASTVIDEPYNDDSEKKNKLRGVFRKVSRFFDKTTNADDNKHAVTIGSFQIALK